MRYIIRLILGIPKPKIFKNAALNIAKEYFTSKGINNLNLRAFEDGLKNWVVWANKDTKSSPWISIDNQTGEIKDEGVPLR